ncbi:heavy metal translocating P-type ATPase [Konateibacter massiliensis]|uniref:heavy metal translocating P-type ATPase n=1 Tax=Konateibacter massiliensis TaxID=2002841 RepID=UPI000C148A8C|nr:cation-translocating P-type ATPase [Konateibacter massiliensis]
MLKQLSDSFSGMKLTLLSAVFLICSIILMIGKISLPFDPAWGAVIISGYPLLYLAMTRLIRQKWISSALLISIAMLASLAIGEIFAAGEVAFIMAIGAILEDKTVIRAQKGLYSLISLTPKEARKITVQNEQATQEMIPVSQIALDDILRILPGETIPTDGIILSGNSSIDQSIMTGESLPVDKEAGDSVFCGTLNSFGTIDIRATHVGEDTSLQKLIRLVQEAEDKKAPMQRIADKWAVYLVPIALLIAVGTFVVMQLLGYDLMISLNRLVTVLVVFCPCALALATPTAIMAAIGQATKHGVIIKSGEALELMGKADVIAFDKTGTLTEGRLTVSDIISFDPEFSEDELLLLCMSVEEKSEHPLAKAIVAHGMSKGVRSKEVTDFQMFPGQGVRANFSQLLLQCGSEAYLEKCDIKIQEGFRPELEKLRLAGKAAIFIAIEQRCIGVIALTDVLREHAKDVIQKLKQMNLDIILLTGDHIQSAGYMANQAGIAHMKAGLLPAGKVEQIQDMQEKGKTVCMIGDGINDAPALKASDVSIVMGGMGSDITIEASDIALMSSDITRIPYLKRLANSTVKTIRGNIIASMCINAIAITLSVLGLLNPVTGALVHNAGSVLVVLNAALLYDRKFL